MLAGDRVVFEADGCFFDEGAGFLRSILPWLAGHSRSFYITCVSSEEAILVVPLRGVPVFLRPSTSRWQFFAYLFGHTPNFFTPPGDDF
jgi:hypothetical protein